MPLTRRFIFFAAGILLGVGIAVGVWCVRRRHVRAAGPLQVSLWYWRQPFRIPASDVPVLLDMGVTTLFVRAGTITRDADTGALRMVMPQEWPAPQPPKISVHLVFNADYSVIRHLDGVSDGALRTVFSDAIGRERERAVRAGVTVAGVQLDCDFPTRLLPRYGRLLTSLRAELRHVSPVPISLSITALPTWLASREMDGIAEKVDFFAPQFYESVLPQTFDAATDHNGFATIGDEARLRRGLERAGHQNTLFWAGLPAYGHALVYDGKGQLRGAFHDASVLDMLKQPYYRLARAYPASAEGDHPPAVTAAQFGGEEIVVLEPKEVGAPDRTDFHLVYDLPTATLVARQLAIVRESRPDNCAGVILFRYPDADATLSVPLRSLATVVRRKSTPSPRLVIRAVCRPVAPWNKIEGGPAADTNGAAGTLTITVTNVGDGSAGVGVGAVDVSVHFDHPCLRGEALPSGAFDLATPFANHPGNACSVARATGIHLSALHLAPGESRTTGSLPVTAGNIVVSGDWTATGDGGFSTFSGKMTPNHLGAKL